MGGDYRNILEVNKMIRNMGRNGDYWLNALMESFFATLKTELIHNEIFITRKDAQSKIFNYIEMFYNRKRRHSSLGYKSPVEFEMTTKPT